MSGTRPLVSSAIALSTKAIAAPAPRPARDFVRLLLLGGATLALIGVLHQVHAPTPASPAAEQLALNHLFDKNTAPVPAGPSVFMQEQTLPASALMARWEPLIIQASHRFKVPAEWIRAVMRQESGGRTMLGEDRPIVSDAGALGIMQVMPGTYTEMAAQYGLGANPFDPKDNIYAGAAYLKWLHLKYGYPAMFAAYNDGPGNIEDHLHRGRPLPAETRGYIAAIGKSLGDKSVGANLTKVALTQPDGTKVEIDARTVSAVRPAIPGIYAASVRAVVSVGRVNRGVREDVAAATALLRGHGAKI